MRPSRDGVCVCTSYRLCGSGRFCFLGRASAGSTYCWQAVGMDFPLNATEVRRARRERVKFFNDFDDGAGPSSARDRVRSHGRRAGGNNFIRTRVGHLARVVLHHGGSAKEEYSHEGLVSHRSAVRSRDLRNDPDLSASNAAWCRTERRWGEGLHLRARPSSSTAGGETRVPSRAPCCPSRLLLILVRTPTPLQPDPVGALALLAPTECSGSGVTGLPMTVIWFADAPKCASDANDGAPTAGPATATGSASDTARQCCPRHGDFPARSGSSSRPNNACASPVGCPGQPSQPVPSMVGFAVSSSLL